MSTDVEECFKRNKGDIRRISMRQFHFLSHPRSARSNNVCLDVQRSYV